MFLLLYCDVLSSVVIFSIYIYVEMGYSRQRLHILTCRWSPTPWASTLRSLPRQGCVMSEDTIYLLLNRYTYTSFDGSSRAGIKPVTFRLLVHRAAIFATEDLYILKVI